MAVTPKGEVSVEEPSRAQQSVARRVAQSKATVPDLTLAVEVDMAAAEALLAGLPAAAGEQPAPSVEDLILCACALALSEHPHANGSYRDGSFELHGRVNIGVVMEAGDSVVVPTVFDADRKSLAQIAAQTRGLAQRAADATITAAELAGATFTVAALAVDSFTAVVLAPQAAVLALGAVRDAPVVRDGAVVAGRVLSATLSCDHRILDGATAASFLGRVRELLEAPASLGALG